ncbi:hypothetical protein JCM9279_001720 [Rhodotorula babjevae]
MLTPGLPTTAPGDPPSTPAPLVPAAPAPPPPPPRHHLAPSTHPRPAPPPAPPTHDPDPDPPTKRRRRTLDPAPSPFPASAPPPPHPHPHPHAPFAPSTALATDIARALGPHTATAFAFAAPPAATATEQPHPTAPLAPPLPAPQTAALDELDQVKNGKYGYHLQLLACASTARASHPLKPLLALDAGALKCQACTSKLTGFTCAFVGVRSFPLDKQGRPVPYPVFRDADEDADEGEGDERPVFPLVRPAQGAASTATFTSSSSSTTSPPPAFNTPLTPRHAALLRTAAASHLPPHLALELAHAHQPRCARVRRALGTRTTCDGCGAAVLAGSWICGACGREYCLECAGRLEEAEAEEEEEGDGGSEAGAKLGEKPGGVVGLGAAQGGGAGAGGAAAGAGARPTPDAAWDKLTRCKGGARPRRHTHAMLVPLTRIAEQELARVMGDMERWAAAQAQAQGAAAEEGRERAGAGEGGRGGESDGEEQERAAWDAWVERHRVTSGGETEAEHGRPFVRLGAGLVPPRLDEGWRRAASAPADEEDAPPGGMGQEALFRRLWRRGEPLLVDLERLERAPGASSPSPPSTSTSTSTPAPSSSAPQRTDPPPAPPPPPPAPPAAAAHGLPALPWSPAFLAAAYGDRPCTVGNNVDDAERKTTVGRFFGGFGRASGRGARRGGREGKGSEAGGAGEEENQGEGEERQGAWGWDDGGAGARERAKPEARFESEKIKDWPAARDFREYPELWHDFMDILPAGSITRRDGVLNVSAHVPVNANPPDLGPKGYFSEISDDGEGGNGSTRLHTVNILMWASDMPNGSPGVAVWDLYAAEDTDKIRDFLYGHIAKLEGWKDADEARKRVDDPIHTQRIFLSAPLRAALLASHGVRSFRILQRPHQAVFIPAGCAHQVCNLADCIKVATDFVSVENVARCWKLSDEFHAQTKSKSLWCPDVLELKSMLLWAWYSAERLDDAQDAQPEQQGSTGGVDGEDGTASVEQDAEVYAG